MKFIVPALLSLTLAVPLFSQTDMEYVLSKQKGNKIVPLAEWGTEVSTKWAKLLDSEEIYGYGFSIPSRNAIENPNVFSKVDIGAFRSWLRQRNGLGPTATWVALDVENKLLASGAQAPDPKEFERTLESKGLKSPLRKLRDFLKENPGHLDASADLLLEARRRALQLMQQLPPSADKDLDDATDLRTWAIMAAETDKVFNGQWLGLGISFFRLGEASPERRSKLMRGVFRRQLPKVESALMQHPTNDELWNIWLWMAEGAVDYDWKKLANFINGIEPTIFSTERHSLETMPSPEASAWVVQQARARKDWAAVKRFAKVAPLPISHESQEAVHTEWVPGEVFNIAIREPEPPKGHPIETVYAPHAEAFLRLGDVGGANGVYDEMLRIEGRGATELVGVARALGMKDLAKTWEKGGQVSPVKSIVPEKDSRLGYGPCILVSETMMGKYMHLIDEQAEPYNDALSENMRAILGKLKLGQGMELAYLDSLEDIAGWKEGDGHWALVSSDRRILHESTETPDLATVAALLVRFGIENSNDVYRKLLKDRENQPGIELQLAWGMAPYDRDKDERDEADTTEALGRMNKVLRENPDSVVYVPGFGLWGLAIKCDDSKKPVFEPLAKPMLSIIEPLLERKPSARNLWEHWLFWSDVEGKDRSIETLVERLRPSPFSGKGFLELPLSVLDEYLESCKENGNWSKAAALLKGVWDRLYARMLEGTDPKKYDLEKLQKVGIQLVEAYTKDGRQGEADEISKAMNDLGAEPKAAAPAPKA